MVGGHHLTRTVSTLNPAPPTEPTSGDAMPHTSSSQDAVGPSDVPRSPTVAVVAHSGKTLGGGLRELRETLVAAGIDDPIWFEVPKSKMAPKRVQLALDHGADLVFVWGGDGIVQRCIDA